MEPDAPEFVVVFVGSFADPSFPPPTESGYDFRRHPWIGLPDSLGRDEGSEAWAPIHPLYEAGRYAEAADRGREVLQAVPHPRVLYNVACCESLAGRQPTRWSTYARRSTDGRASGSWRSRTPTSNPSALSPLSRT